MASSKWRSFQAIFKGNVPADAEHRFIEEYGTSGMLEDCPGCPECPPTDTPEQQGIEGEDCVEPDGDESNPAPVDIGAILSRARKRADLTLRDVETVTGVPNAHISQIETGRIKRPSLEVLYELTLFYDLDFSVLSEGYAHSHALVALRDAKQPTQDNTPNQPDTPEQQGEKCLTCGRTSTFPYSCTSIDGEHEWPSEQQGIEGEDCVECSRCGEPADHSPCPAPNTLEELTTEQAKALYALTGEQPASDDTIREARRWLSGVLHDRHHGIAEQSTEGCVEPGWTDGAITDDLNRVAVATGVRWDRLVDERHRTGVISVYGWLARNDGRADFLLLRYGPEPDLSHFVTSSVAIDDAFGGSESEDNTPCERVEHRFPAAHNAIRLAGTAEQPTQDNTPSQPDATPKSAKFFESKTLQNETANTPPREGAEQRVEGEFHYAVEDVVVPTAPMWAIKRKDDDYPVVRISRLTGELFVRDQIKELDEAARHFFAAGIEVGERRGWRPIESAPKDGRRLLVCRIGSTREGDSGPYFGRFINGEWYVLATRCVHSPPTHWMPVPALPTHTQEGE